MEMSGLYHLVVLDEYRKPDTSGNLRDYVKARCVCSNEFETQRKSIFSGNTTSCGCRRKQTLKRLLTTHGEFAEGKKPRPEVLIYYGIKKRCSNPDEPNYGGRGIECKFESFEDFFNEVGARPSSTHSIDRVDSNGHYEPGNVRWATRAEQARNTRVNPKLTIDGETLLVREWCERFDIPIHRYYNHKKRGLDVKLLFRGVQ